MKNNWPSNVEELIEECERLEGRYDLYTLGEKGEPLHGETEPRVDGTDYLAGEYQYGVAMIPVQWVTHVLSASTEQDEPDTLKLHERMNAALLDMQEELLAYHPRDRENASSKELIDSVIAAHQIIEDAATGVGTCVDKDSDPNDFKCSACGAHSFIQANDTYTTILDDHLTVLKKFNYCPNCGKRIIEEATE